MTYTLIFKAVYLMTGSTKQIDCLSSEQIEDVLQNYNLALLHVKPCQVKRIPLRIYFPINDLFHCYQTFILVSTWTIHDTTLLFTALKRFQIEALKSTLEDLKNKPLEDILKLVENGNVEGHFVTVVFTISYEEN